VKVSIITGITGQDGAYLAQFLLKKGHKVIGVLRHHSSINLKNLIYLDIVDSVVFETCDLTKQADIINIINKHKPDEIYNLAAQSSVGMSFSNPIETLNFNIVSTLNLLETIKTISTKTKFYQASSSEIFGQSNHLPFTEKSILHPVSPYGISKASAHWITVNYRESYGVFATSGILFNHESVLRNDNFIIKKIIKSSLDILSGKIEVLEVGNMDIRRDFGYAPRYVEAMYLMMQRKEPDDYVICSGVSLSIRDIIYYIFEKLDIDKSKILVNKRLFRPSEIENIYGDPTKAHELLGWSYDLSFFAVLDILLEEERSLYE
jgi:GDPmannose 4,6-dehydratase